ncbi:MAG: hypothetical protein OSJ58_09385 [Dysosmobacter sp.]|nr:hypothetical protein [Dysosmobacter sp.]
MSEKEKAPTREATQVEAAETAAFSGAVISCNHSITDGAERQPGFIAGLLLYGPENGLTLKDLVHITQWPERAIRKEIEVERRAGALIMSDNRNGYFLTDDPAVARKFVHSMRHRARQIWSTARATEAAAGLTRRDSQQLDGQGCIWDGGDSDG